MMQHAILTAIGADRPGIVDELTEYIFSRGGNLADSRMVNLRGQFAMMVLVEGAPDSLTRIRADLPGFIKSSRLHADLKSISAEASATTGTSRPYRLTGSAMDQPGLVHRISHLLRSADVNIENLETSLRPAPYSGSPMFTMELTLSIPGGVPINRLKQELGALCDELNIDWEMEAL